MNKSEARRLESVGWGFYLIVAVVLSGPCIYAAWKIKYDFHPWSYAVGLGAIFAAAIAGVVAWAVNTVLQSRVNRAKLAARKAAKRRK
ncbi:MAG: hypothetical protein HY706_11945 [Candidatus Hydrogenedentes bacterium]|nr:hypothetical protein [Candidatus Hydrogenedentota bacterium]